MPTQENTTTPQDDSRRTFLKRAALSAAAATAATLASGRLLLMGSKESQLPDQGSIFAPRREDLLRHWRQKMSRFRLR